MVFEVLGHRVWPAGVAVFLLFSRPLPHALLRAGSVFALGIPQQESRIQPVLFLAAGRERIKSGMAGKGAKPPSWSHMMSVTICKY